MSKDRGVRGDVEGASREGGGRAVVSVRPPNWPSGVGVDKDPSVTFQGPLKASLIIHVSSFIMHRSSFIIGVQH